MEGSLIDVLQSLFKRDLAKLREEIAAYQHEENIWVVEKDIKNSAGNLCLHLAGNLRTFIGAELGKSGYVRQRDLEFSRKDVPRSELLAEVDRTETEVLQGLRQLTPERLQADYPLNVFGTSMTTAYFLIHLATHMTYHLGQVNYHRRLLDH
ncbi:Protein of unknown function [Catalinimonas alkaloidigena]|uniref:DinB superfamily protein n=1 Tax=Catalinimonas alkaloidigena TaxID=1075417 RepID=A0A1G9FEM7_9BACT|nr:DinB family protein [Catalinimonas alkaloidigena]SDK86792.1 Protein of unknown function [Catalinimonas alkaloidigena]